MSTWGVFESAGNLIYTTDQIIAFLFYGMCIVAILSAAFLNSETINIPLTIFELPFVMIVAFIMSNVAHGILTNPAYATVVPHFGQTIILFAQAPLFMFIFIIIYIIVIVARPSFSSGGGGGGPSLIP